MSDEKGGAVATAGVHYAPKCCVGECDKWGLAGFAASKHVEARWWCWEHYPHKHETPEQREAASIAARLGIGKPPH
ncbi:hypothetical protein QO002_006186 [Pararhizobium capsulatum DSM 1112]|uniref:Uncharacterized protein n=1 Tax=Pararhizobium capsulatum DSM 1112 TaxID=1121113 RepID=A0ABU0C1Z3_9HYPH|nr:hypothetical protein [Pararhizobium capsulatum DSM 1112]